MFLCNIALYSIGPCFHHQSHPQLSVVFTLALSPHSFWSYFSTDLLAYWASTDLESSSFSVISFCLFILFIGFSRQECWSVLPFPSPADHILSELSKRTHQRLHCWQLNSVSLWLSTRIATLEWFHLSLLGVWKEIDNFEIKISGISNNRGRTVDSLKKKILYFMIISQWEF